MKTRTKIIVIIVVLYVLALIVVEVHPAQYKISRCESTHTVSGPLLTSLNIQCKEQSFNRTAMKGGTGYYTVVECPADNGQRRAVEVKCTPTDECQQRCNVNRWGWYVD